MKTTMKKSLPEYAPDSIYKIQLKKGMKFILLVDNKSTEAKRGDIVKVTAVTSNGYYNDYEMLRISNDKYSWRTDRSSLTPT